MIIKENKFLLKIYFEEKTKRSFLPLDYTSLIDVCLKSFPILIRPDNFELYYNDEDNDQILLESQFDYENACHYIKNNNKNILTLKITIKLKNKHEDKSQIKFLENSSIANSIINYKLYEDKNFEKIHKENYSFNKSKQDEDEYIDLHNFACDYCGRKFSHQNAQLKHSKVCKKVFGTKRIPFDSKCQRNSIGEYDYKKKDNLENLNEKIIQELDNLKFALSKWRKSCSNFLNKKKEDKKLLRDIFIDFSLKECPHCKRNFGKGSYPKHVNYCQAVLRKRKPFDSRKQRIITLEQAAFLRKRDNLEKNKNLLNQYDEKLYDKKPRWRRLSDRFRIIMKISKLLYSAC